jgi:hypothetical protein
MVKWRVIVLSPVYVQPDKPQKIATGRLFNKKVVTKVSQLISMYNDVMAKVDTVFLVGINTDTPTVSGFDARREL